MSTRDEDNLGYLKAARRITESNAPEVWQLERLRKGMQAVQMPARVRGLPRPSQVYADNHQASFVIGPIGVVVWRGESTRESLVQVRKLGDLVLERASRPVGLIHIVESTAEVPCLSVRMLHAKISDELYASGVAGFAGVVSGFGINAWSCGILTGLTQMAKSRYPFRSFRTTVDACVWLTGLLEESPVDCLAVAREIDNFGTDSGVRLRFAHAAVPA